MLLIARTRFAETAVDELASSCVGSAAVVAAVAVVAAGAGALLDDVSEPFSSFGSWKASSAAKTTIRPTSISFFRRSAAFLAASRRAEVLVSIALIRASLLRHRPCSKSKCRWRPQAWPPE